MHYWFLAAILVALVAIIIVASRFLERRVRTGSPPHGEARDEWFGDDTDGNW